MRKPKRKIRGVERTKLLMCEGITDKRLAECVKRLHSSRDVGFSVKLDDAGGGGPKSAILAAINHAGGFDKRVVFIDSDLPIPKDALAAANNRNIKIIQSSPFCLEGFLMRLMGHKQHFINSDEAKECFHKRYDLDGVVTQEWYEKYITLQHINAVIGDAKHPCQHIMCDLRDVFTIF
ncbi:glycosyltransferase family 2 protein [Enterobacter ludwigii]|nr:glycosyltransferase family 2 protein [Enterobacter ludwigii]